MKTRSTAIFVLIALFFIAGEVSLQATELPSVYKKWLEEEVVYIITPVEREIFLKLQTDRERNLFIDAFWKHRDPTPHAPENEFRTEHYRRISYVNHFYGRESPKPGWKTDRGRIYIILGEPNDIQRFEGKSTTYPAEVWFYQGKTDVGLPTGFNLVFFQEGGYGEYRLYSPLQDGPQALMPTYAGDPMDYSTAYQQLREMEPDLAAVSLSLIPGEDSAGLSRPSIASDLLIQKVETVPRLQVEEKYAQKFLQYKDVVEVEYSANYLDSDSLVKVIQDPSGIYFVHYAIELKRLSVNLYKNNYYTTLKLNGKVSNEEGKTIFQFEKTFSINLDEEQVKQINRQSFDIHDVFPLISGNYKLSILLKNDVSKEFTSLEQNILIPQDDSSPLMSSLLLGYKVSRQESNKERLKPFQLGSYRVYCQPNRVFLMQDTVAVAAQILGLTEELKQQGEIKFAFFKNEEKFREKSKKVRELQDLPNFIEEFPLSEFLPAHYKIQVSLLLDGQEYLSQSEEFDVSQLKSVARPWVYSKVMPEAQDPVIAYLIGTQLLHSGSIDAARINLEKAWQKKPDSVDFALNLAQVYMALGEYRKINPLLSPFLAETQPPKYELYYLLGNAYQKSGELSKAIDIFDKAVSHFGVNTNLLNSLGECYFQLGKIKEALIVWEKSLEISPNQPQIKKNVETLKEKR